MKVLKLVRRLQEYGSVWNTTLEEIIAELKEKDKSKFRSKNIERTALGLSGYGAVIFSELFNEGIDNTAALVNSSISYLCGIIDDEIDNKRLGKGEALTHLDNFEKFLKTGEGFEVLHPFRNFIIKHFPEAHWPRLLDKLTKHKDAVIREVCSRSYDTLKMSRIEIGTSYGEYVAEIISAFSKKPLTSEEIQVLRLHSAGAILLDGVADYYQDKGGGRTTHLSLASDNLRGSFLPKVMYDEVCEAERYFAEARDLVNPEKRKNYEGITNLTKIFYGVSFFKKTLRYLLNSLPLQNHELEKENLLLEQGR